MHHIPDCFNGLASFRGSPLIVSLTRDSGDLWKHFWWIQLLRACVANFPIREGSLFLFHNLLLPLVSVCGHWKFTGATTSSHLTKQDHKVCWSLSQEDPLEKAMATYSSILAWRIQYSWINKMDRGAWQATVHKVTKSWCDQRELAHACTSIWCFSIGLDYLDKASRVYQW